MMNRKNLLHLAILVVCVAAVRPAQAINWKFWQKSPNGNRGWGTDEHLVTSRKAPQLYRILNSAVDALTAAQLEYVLEMQAGNPDAYKWQNERIKISSNQTVLIISDVPDVNAWVESDVQAGKLWNKVTVTTGLLKRFLGSVVETGSDQDIIDNLGAVLGVLAHEMAHPIDKVDTNTLRENSGYFGHRQAIEFRADGEAVPLAKNAGFKADGLLTAFDILAASESPKSPDAANGRNTLFGSHPEMLLRSSLQRILVAFGSLQFGEGTEHFKLNFNRKALAKELAGFTLQGRSGVNGERAFAKIDSVEAGLTALNEIRKEQTAFRDPDLLMLKPPKQKYDLKMKSHVLQIQFRHVLAATIEAWTAPNSVTSPTAEKTLIETLATIAISESNIFDQSNFPKFFLNVTHFQEDDVSELYYKFRELHPLSIEELLNRRGGLAAPLRQALLHSLQGGLGGQNVPEVINYLSEFVASSRLYTELNSEITPWLAKATPGEHAKFIKQFDPQTQLLMSARYFTEVFNKLSVEKKVEAIYEASNDFFSRPTSYSLPFHQSISMRPSTVSRDYVIIGRKEEKENRDQFLKELAATGEHERGDLKLAHHVVIESIWQNRGVLGMDEIRTQEATGARPRTDWQWIVKNLGTVDSKLAAAAIRAEVRKVAESGAYPFVLRHSTVYSSSLATKRTEIAWADMDLVPYLFISAKRSSDKDLQIRAGNLAANFALKNVSAFHRAVIREMVKVIEADGGANGFKDLYSQTDAILDRVYLTPEKHSAHGAAAIVVSHNAWAVAIEKANLSPAIKTALLKDFATNTVSWINHRGAQTTGALLKQHNLIVTASDAVVFNGLHSASNQNKRRRYNEPSRGYSAAARNQSGYVQYIPALEREIAELARLPNNDVNARDVASRIVKIFGAWHQESDLSVRFRSFFDQAFATLNHFDLPTEEKLKLYKLIVHEQGGFPSADAYFKTHLRQAVIDEVRATGKIPAYVNAKYIADPDARLEIVEAFFGQSKVPPNGNDIAGMFLAHAQEASFARDQLIERLVWRLNVDKFEDLQFLERFKSGEAWKALKPEQVSYLSLLASYTASFNRESVSVLLDYYADANRTRLPDSVRNLFAEKIAADHKANRQILPFVSAQLREDVVVKMALEAIELENSRLKGPALIPAFEVLLQTGTQPFAKDPHLVDLISEKHLGLTSTEISRRWLDSHLESVPPYERTVRLAYLMAKRTNTGQSPLRLRDIFEVYTGVGKKAAQAAHTWHLVEEPFLSETREVKDHAEPLSKFKIVKALRDELSPQQFKKIRHFERILGAASLKTVVEVHLDNGEHVAVAVLDEHAGAQIHTNAKFAERFLETLGLNGVIEKSKMAGALIGQFKSQMDDELDMRKEAAKIAKAEKVVQKLSALMKDELNGWLIEVTAVDPDLAATNRTLSMRLAAGVPFDKIEDPKLKAEAGRILTKFYLKAFFKFGWLDADRHVGNQLFMIDPATRKITILDFGQSKQYQVLPKFFQDDRTRVADIAKAAAEGNVDRLYAAIAKVSKPAPGFVAANEAIIKQNVSRIFAGNLPAQDKVLEFVKAFVNQDLVPEPKYFTGVLKGFVTIASENFVTPIEFGEILKAEIVDLYRAKMLPKMMLEALKERRAPVSNTCRLAYGIR